MINKIGFRFAVLTMLIALSAVIVYHILIITEVIPYDVAWGGRLGSRSEMLKFEVISITINLFILIVIAIKGEIIKLKVPALFITILLWVVIVLFALNTLGNLFSLNSLETIVFTPLTLLFAILCYRLVKEPSHIVESSED